MPRRILWHSNCRIVITNLKKDAFFLSKNIGIVWPGLWKSELITGIFVNTIDSGTEIEHLSRIENKLF